MPSRLAVIVVTYNSASTLEACLSGLRAAEDVAQIRVVDNASRDGSLAIAQHHALADARVRFIANPDNPGFATACNQGAADCDAPWLAFINPDLMVEADTLERLRDLGQPLGDCLLGVEQVDAQAGRMPPCAAATPTSPRCCVTRLVARGWRWRLIRRRRCKPCRRCPAHCC